MRSKPASADTGSTHAAAVRRTMRSAALRTESTAMTVPMCVLEFCGVENGEDRLLHE